MSVSLYGSGQTVIQVVYAFNNTTTTTQSATYVDTGLTATITPQSTNSKILVIVTGFIVGGTSSTWAGAQLVRNSTALAIGTGGTNNATFVAGPSGQIDSGATITYLDSPATTSATTYKLQFYSFDGPGYPVGFNRRVDNLFYAGASAITLMEISGA
jgi:hypothetical protein